MAKQKFSKKRFDRFFKHNKAKILEGYLARGGKEGKTKAATTTYARRSFERSVKGILERNSELSQSEASYQATRSNKFNIYSDIAKENWHKMLKEAGINIQMRSLEFVETRGGYPIYRITRGKYAGKYTVMQHFPGQEPSWQIMLVDNI